MNKCIYTVVLYSCGNVSRINQKLFIIEGAIKFFIISNKMLECMSMNML